MERPLVLVSGGPDSVALLRVLLELGADPVALHLDHGLRGAESAADAEFVSELCRSLGVRGEVRRLEFESKSNFQEVARRERYRVARELLAVTARSSIATGHTRDDVAETVLINLSRGAGLGGLSGIPPVRGERREVVRPLIDRSRREVLEYLQSLGQPYRTDSSNLRADYTRNRLRLEVLPVLEELYPGAGANLSRAAALAREDLAALEELAAGMLEERAGEEFAVPVSSLEGLPPRMRRQAMLRAVRVAYRRLLAQSPEPALLESVHVAAAMELLEETSLAGGTRTLDLPGGVVAAARYGAELALYRRPGGGSEPDVVDLVAGGEFRYSGWRVVVSEAAFDAGAAARPEVAYLAPSLGPYRVRLPLAGDVLRPLGLGGTKGVFRAMMDRKVPKDVRSRTPVVVDGRDRVAWIFCGELDEEFRVRAGERSAIRIEVEKG